SDRDVVGISIGTRPDCITDDILSLIDGYTKKYHVWIEYGLQSIHDKTLRRINRGHDSRIFLDAVQRTKNTCINICVHVILGLPGETEDEMLETAEAVASLGIQGIKLHHLYVAKNTALAEEYFQGKVQTLDMNTYIKLAVGFLERIPSDVTVQRLVGDTHGNFLLSPVWKASKAEITDGITQEFERRGAYQGLRYTSSVSVTKHAISCPSKTMEGQETEALGFHTINI
ncbi:MAG: TIGR01212 family radical SAM protein, partial [Candidatus Brocadia sp.]